MNGWVKAYRKIQENWIWTSKEPYDMRSAWQYLIMNAYYSDGKVLTGKGELVEIKRGQIWVSVRALSEKWKWSVSKVRKFLNRLEDEKMVKRTGGKSGTLLTIVNYGFYQGCENNEETITDTVKIQSRYNQETMKEQSKDNHRYSEDTITDTMKIQSANSKEEYKNNKEYKEDKKERKEEDIFTVSSDTVCQTQSVKRIVEKWNELSAYGVKEIIRIAPSAKRYKMLVARIKEYGEDKIVLAIENIKNSDYLQGKNRDGWAITFDWFVMPSNFPKVLDGNYDNRVNKQREKTKTEQMLDNSYEMINEWLRSKEDEPD